MCDALIGYYMFWIHINTDTWLHGQLQEIIVGVNQLEVSRQIGMMGAYDLLENWSIEKTKQADACHGRVEDIESASGKGEYLVIFCVLSGMVICDPF